MALNVVIPMVGLGKRFFDAGYNCPKPLIPVNGKTIVEHAVTSLKLNGHYIFVIRKNDFSEELAVLLKKLQKTSTIIEVDHLTEGPAASILMAEKLINNDDELISANCDQLIDWDPLDFIKFCRNNECDGVVATYPHDGIVLNQKSPYSFIATDASGRGINLEEKFAISYNALCGIHYWKHGKYFIDSAIKLIKDNDRVNNEFYVSKTYNYLIREGRVIKNYPLQKGQFFSLGTPEDVKKYENL